MLFLESDVRSVFPSPTFVIKSEKVSNYFHNIGADPLMVRFMHLP